MMPSCFWSRSAYCVSTLCIRSSIEPAAIRYRRIIAYIYCSSCLSKLPTIELTPSVRITAGRRFSYRHASPSSPPRSSLAKVLVDVRMLGHCTWSVFLLPYPDADERTRQHGVQDPVDPDPHSLGRRGERVELVGAGDGLRHHPREAYP